MTEETKTDSEALLSEEESCGVINLEGELTIQRAREIFELFSGFIELGNPLLIDLSNIEKIDLSLLQLLYSLNKEAKTRNQAVYVKGPFKDTVRIVLTTSGFFSLQPYKAAGFERDFYELSLC